MLNITVHRLADLRVGDRIVPATTTSCARDRGSWRPSSPPIELGSPVDGVRLELPSAQSMIERVLYPSQVDGRAIEVVRP